MQWKTSTSCRVHLVLMVRGNSPDGRLQVRKQRTGAAQHQGPDPLESHHRTKGATTTTTSWSMCLYWLQWYSACCSTSPTNGEVIQRFKKKKKKTLRGYIHKFNLLVYVRYRIPKCVCEVKYYSRRFLLYDKCVNWCVCTAGSHVSRSRLWWKHGLASWIMPGKERNYTATVASSWTLTAFRKTSPAKVWENLLNTDALAENRYRFLNWFDSSNQEHKLIFLNYLFKELAHKSHSFYSWLFELFINLYYLFIFFTVH